MRKRTKAKTVTARLAPVQRRHVSATTKELKRAQHQARVFHGTDAGEVVKIPARARKLPAYGVVLGSIPELEYEPDAKSQRGKYRWVHQSGDRGFLRKKSRRQPLLVVDPNTGRPFIDFAGSPMRFNDKAGLIG